MRTCTNWIIEQCEEGNLEWESVAMSCLAYMSESNVRDMAECDFDFCDEEDNE